jgi:phytoene/squalene synthetase
MIDKSLLELIIAGVGLVSAMIAVARVAVSSLADTMRTVIMQQSKRDDETRSAEIVLRQEILRQQERIATVMDNHLSGISAALGKITLTQDLIVDRLLDAVVIPKQGLKAITLEPRGDKDEKS